MIDNYKVKLDNNEEVLFLYINYNYEFGYFSINNKNNVIKNIKDYIVEHKIKFNGNKIKLVVSGIVLCTLILSKSDFINYQTYNNNSGYSYVSNIVFDSDYDLRTNKDTIEDVPLEENSSVNVQNIDEVVEDVKVLEEKINSNSSSVINETTSVENNIQDNNENINNTVVTNPENSKIVTLYRTRGDILEISLYDYLVGVVASEMPASFNEEAIKTQAIVSRTYTLKLLKQNKILTDDSQTQNYRDIEYFRNYWGVDFDKYYSKIKNAVSETSGIVITYNNELIDAVFHSTSNGYTEDAVNVWGYDIPYLKKVDSSFDVYSTPYYREVEYSYEQLSNILGMNINNDTNIVIYKNVSNRVSVIYFDGIAFNGVNFRNLLGLRSSDFDIKKYNDKVTIATRGYGHGVGLSQYGSNFLAQQGYTYEQIIKYYYTGVSLNKT